eukprot:scaffold2738_cov119-Cylindrotheca_fusiformis.AAC.12
MVERRGTKSCSTQKQGMTYGQTLGNWELRSSLSPCCFRLEQEVVTLLIEDLFGGVLVCTRNVNLIEIRAAI